MAYLSPVKPNRQKGTQLGRVRLRRVCNASEPSLLSFVTSVVEPGTVVCTDGWRSYGKLATSGYPHRVTVGSGPPAASTDPLLPHVHQVASLLKRWLLGTHQGAVSREHLDYYLDEFTFRFNRRTSRARGLLFYRLLDRAVRTAPATTASLFRGTNRGKRSLTGANHKMLGGRLSEGNNQIAANTWTPESATTRYGRQRAYGIFPASGLPARLTIRSMVSS